jgi:hypothetical protein
LVLSLVGVASCAHADVEIAYKHVVASTSVFKLSI